MIKKTFSLNLFIISLLTFNGFAQVKNQNPDETYNLAIQETAKGNIPEAIKLYKYSISEFENPDSYFDLAKIYFRQNTVESRAKARELIQKAIWKKPESVEYRLLQAELMESFSRNLAYQFYEDIIKIDPKCADAWYNLGRIKEEEYYEYSNSVLQVESDPALSFDNFAYKDFIMAERFFNTTINIDSSFFDAYIHLACIFEDIGQPQKGISYLKKLIELEPENKDANLILGLLYYKTSEIDSASSAYNTALELMTDKEKNDFKFQSASFLLKDKLSEKLAESFNSEIENTVNNFWQISDPLFLTDYNERLLEHFSRVAYSNLKFSVDELNILGWDSDRGETVIRYGEPLKRVRYRPHINAGGRTQLMLKTDFWYYQDKVLGFVDEYWNEDYRFSSPRTGSRHLSQFPGDSDFFINNLRRNDPEYYEPKFKGPVIDVPFNIVQFKNIDSDSLSTTQVYINYALESEDKITPTNQYPIAHKYGIFFYKEDSGINTKQLNRLIDLDHKRNLKLSLYDKYKVNSVLVDLPPDSGVIAFEIIRDNDHGVFTKRTNFEINKFNNTDLDISSIILATDIDESNELAIKRGDLNILPNPLNTFTSMSQIFIYFEVYNLQSDENGTSIFEQRITISKADEESDIGNVFSSLLGIFGLGEGEKQITISTKYQSYEKDAPVYLQLDMSNYEKGIYNLNIEIEDIIVGSKANSQTVLKWK